MKKVLLLVLCSVLVLVALTGCGSKSESSESAGTDNTATASKTGKEADTSASNSGEIMNIIWQYPTPGNNGPGFQDVEDAFNAMLEKDIGVHVKFELVPLMDSQKRATLMVSAGEQLDISLTAFTSLGPLVERGLIHPLDELVEEYGQGIKEACGESLMGGSYDGKLYGIPPADRQGNSYGYLAQTELLQKYGIDVDNDKYYTTDEIEQIFATVKAGEGEGFYCEIPWNTTPEPLNNGYLEYDKVAGAIGNGVLMLNRGFENNTKIENIFATDEYREYAEMKYRWAQAGYISPDAAITTEFPDALMQTQNYLGSFYWADPAAESSYEATVSFDLTLFKMVKPYVAGNGGKLITWNIPITSGSPEKAMEALNYLYTSKEATKLIQFGIEGKSYKVLQKTDEAEQIQYLEDDTSKLPYFNPYGLWGNILEWPAVYPAPINKNQIMKEWDAAIPKSRYSPAIGYTFVQTDVATEIAAVQAVVDQYTPIINCGAMDPAESLPEFLSALEAAGVDKIIQENQRQFDAWLADKR